jgi:hypothetical protein
MYSVLDQKLFDTYIELKCEPIIAIIEPNMYMGKFDWAKCVRPTGARQEATAPTFPVGSAQRTEYISTRTRVPLYIRN